MAPNSTGEPQRRCRDEPLPNPLRENDVADLSDALRGRRTQLGDHLVPIRDEHGLPARREPDVLAQPVAKLLDADGAHRANVATGGYRSKLGSSAKRSSTASAPATRSSAGG